MTDDPIDRSDELLEWYDVVTDDPIDRSDELLEWYDEDAAAADCDGKKKRRSVAAQLVDLATSHYRLGVTDSDEPFGTSSQQPHIARMLRGGKTGLRAELARRYFDDHNLVPSQSALADACTVIEGRAATQTPQKVWLRVAETPDAAWIDLGDRDCRVIRISGGGWTVENAAPVLFRRTALTAPMPLPQPGGTLDELWRFVPIAEEDRDLLLAYMVAALIQADVPHPVLLLSAEHGSAKSSTTRRIVDLIDPSPVPLRKAPRDSESWVTAASASWVVGLDNLSGDLPQWFSDALCRASTGDGDVRRRLYTDGDPAVFSFRRVVIANGVAVGVTAADLADRIVTVALPRLTTYQDEKVLAAEWEQARPGLFGALLDLAAAVHARLPTVTVDKPPRMADFARVLAAVDEVRGGRSLDRYREQRSRATAQTLDGVPLVAAITDREYACQGKPAAEILGDLTPTDPSWRPPQGWPKTARALTSQLTRHAPALREQGWQIDNDGGRNHNNRALWTIAPPQDTEKSRDFDSRDSHNSHSQVRGENGRELERESCESASQTREPASQGILPNSRENRPLTCEDEPASHASQNRSPSLSTVNAATDHPTPPPPGAPTAATPGVTERVQQTRDKQPSPVCRYCGDPLKFADDRRDGFHSSRTACVTAHRRAS